MKFNRSTIQIVLGAVMVVLALGFMVYQWQFTEQLNWLLMIAVVCGGALVMIELGSSNRKNDQ